jgi:Tol biopolymer transport system component
MRTAMVTGVCATLLLASMTAVGAEFSRAELITVGMGGVPANADSGGPSLSGDGRYVAFHSWASNLTPGDTNGYTDVFVHDTHEETTQLVSVDAGGGPADGDSYGAAISADGRWIAFHSRAEDLVPDDTNGVGDVFLHDRLSGTTTRVSVDSSGRQADQSSDDPAISADGTRITFSSWATDLVQGDTNGEVDIFVHDTTTRRTTRVSVSTDGTESNGTSAEPAISLDGRVVAFSSFATTLDGPDTNRTSDIFVHDLLTGQTTRISEGPDGRQANSYSYTPSLSQDGSQVAFDSAATNLDGPVEGGLGVFVVDVATRAVELVAEGSTGVLSGDGRYIAYVAGDIFVRDRLTGRTVQIPSSDPNATGPDVWNTSLTISVDGRWVAFDSSSDLLDPEDQNRLYDVFRFKHLFDGYFVDDDGSVFEADIDAIASSGITRGCNPPANDRFCPEETVTRGQMAAFLNRALGLAAVPDQGLVDVEGSVFAADIDALYAAGITRGCNPPVNDRFCPEETVTRGQMAAFLNRALSDS